MKKATTTAQHIKRSIGMGVLLSMVIFYGIHVLGSWTIENYRPDPDTTSTLLLHNKCIFFNKVHTLRPNNGMPNISDGINKSKLSGSFMNFTDGHVADIIILALLISGITFAFRMLIKKNRQVKVAM